MNLPDTQPKFHVLGLTPREQLALRCLLFNSYSDWINKTIREAVTFLPDQVEEKASYTFKLFCKYNDIIDLLANEENLGRAKPTFLVISNEAIKLISIAVKNFNDKQHFLGDKVERVKPYYENLKKKVLESADHRYTRKEIEDAKKRK